MAVGGMDDRDGRLRQPAVDHIQRLLCIPWARQDSRVGDHAYEAGQNRPGQCNGLRARESVLYPTARLRMPNRALVRRVDEQVDIGELHLPCSSLRMISSS